MDLLYDLQWGCNIGYKGPHFARITPNLKSALLHPATVSEALAKEVSRGHTAGPFPSSPIPNLQRSPLRVVPKKDGTWRIIMDLSSLHGSSINDYISKDEYTLHYATISDKSPWDTLRQIAFSLSFDTYTILLPSHHVKHPLLPPKQCCFTEKYLCGLKTTLIRGGGGGERIIFKRISL